MKNIIIAVIAVAVLTGVAGVSSASAQTVTVPRTAENVRLLAAAEKRAALQALEATQESLKAVAAEIEATEEQKAQATKITGRTPSSMATWYVARSGKTDGVKPILTPGVFDRDQARVWSEMVVKYGNNGRMGPEDRASITAEDRARMRAVGL